MKKKLKRHKLYINLCLFSLIFLFAGGVAYAKTVTDTVKPKIDKYDFENYRSVAHFDKGWNPFGKEGIAEMFNGIADFLFTINRMLVDITDTAIDYLYNLNAIDKFSGKVQDIANGMFTEFNNGLITIIFVIAGVCIYIFYATGNSRDAGKKVFLLLVSTILAFGFFTNSSYYFKATSKVTNGLEGLVTNSLNVDGTDYNADNYQNTVNTVRNNYFNTTIEKPYMLMNYGVTDMKYLDKSRQKAVLRVLKKENDPDAKKAMEKQNSQRVTKLLKLSNTKANKDKIEKITKNEVEKYDNNWMSSALVINKIVIALFACVNTFILSVIYIAISMFKLMFHVLAMVLLVFLPIVYLASVISNSGVSFVKACATTLGYILLGALSSLLFGLLSLMVYIANELVPQTSMGMYFLNCVVFYVIMFIAFKKRNKIIEFMTKGKVALNPSNLGQSAMNKSKQAGGKALALGVGAVSGGAGAVATKYAEQKQKGANKVDKELRASQKESPTYNQDKNSNNSTGSVQKENSKDKAPNNNNREVSSDVRQNGRSKQGESDSNVVPIGSYKNNGNSQNSDENVQRNASVENPKSSDKREYNNNVPRENLNRRPQASNNSSNGNAGANNNVENKVNYERDDVEKKENQKDSNVGVQKENRSNRNVQPQRNDKSNKDKDLTSGNNSDGRNRSYDSTDKNSNREINRTNQSENSQSRVEKQTEDNKGDVR
ncbi:hypothetical protein E4T72_13280 [Staphylococcus xylosus]|uniref:CD3337/EF1877 family mobilome membrane protein n=1 Tax=Staphylococcus xylosus TaxID=1288 RepID=UPI001072EAAD|nr:hypothetical protein [Staphylococcus xylosus]MBF0812026.1 hypothetical protein [Staphylococcus xylosus]TFV19892.1 hypothetical protein E4T72_13280 [Staphylococcus xylosus]